MKKILTNQGFRFPLYLVLAFGLILGGGANSVKAAMTATSCYDANSDYGPYLGTTVTFTCANQTVAVPSTGYLAFYPVNGAQCTVAATTLGTGWSTAYITIYWYNGSVWTPLAAAATTVSFTANTANSTEMLIETTSLTTCVTIGSYSGPATFPAGSATLTYHQTGPAVTAALSGGTATICTGSTPATFTATGGGGQNAYTYLWYKAGASTGITTSTYTAGALTTGSYAIYCAITGTNSCGTTNTSTYTVTVNAASVAGTLTQSPPASGGHVCDGSGVTYTLSGQTGTFNYFQYQWNASPPNSGSWGTTNPYTWTSSLSGASVLYVDAIVTNGVCPSATSNIVNVTVDAPSVAGTVTQSPASGTHVCDGNGVTYTLAGNTGTFNYFQYQWNASPPNSGSWGTSNPYTWTSSLSGASVLYVDAIVTNGVCPAATTNIVNVTVDAPSVGGTVTQSPASGGEVCTGSNVTYTLAGQTGTFNYFQYQWNASPPNSGSWNPGNGAAVNPGIWASGLNGASILYVDAVVTNGVCPSTTSNIVSVTVESSLTNTLSGGSTNLCYNTAPAQFTATAGGSGGTYAYQWYNSSGAISGATASTYTAPSLTASNSYYCAVTSAPCGTVNTSAYAVNVYGSFSAALTGGSTNLCNGATPTTFTATPTGGVATYTYQWYNSGGAISGATASTYSAGSLTASNSYYCSVTSGASCGTVSTGTYSVNVYGQLTAVLSGGSTNLCYSTTPTAFTATGGGGNGTYTYQWYKGGSSVSGATASTYSAGVLTASTTVYCAVSSNSCTVVNTSTYSVNVYAQLTAVLSGGSTNLCDNTAPNQFTATAGGASGTYTYQWYNSSGSISGATASTYTAPSLTASNSYYCAVTSNGCTVVNTSTYSVNVYAQLTAAISGGSTNLCYNAAPAQFTATGGGGSGTYTYQWYNGSGSISGATASTYTAPALTASNTYYCAVSSNGCAVVNTSTYSVNVYAQLTAVLSGGSTNLCYNTAPAQFTATAGGANGTYTYQWYNGSGSISGATASTYTAPSLTASNSYYCAISSNSCTVVNTSTYSVNVYTATLTASQTPVSETICNGTDPGAFTATASGASGTYTYQWYNSYSGSIGGATSSTYDPGALTSTQTYYCAISSGVCSVNTTAQTITVTSASVSGTISGGTSAICYSTSPGTFTATASGGNGIFTYQWYNSSGAIGGATASTYSPGTITASNSYYCAVSSGLCGTSNTSTSAVSVDAQVTASVSPSATSAYCSYTSSGVLVATAGGGTSGYTYLWSNSLGTGSTATPTLATGTAYSVTVTDSKSCTASASSGSISVDPALTATPSPASATTLCSYATGSAISAGAAGGTSGYTYAWNNSLGTGANGTPTITSATVYSVTVTDSKSCTASGSTGAIGIDAVVTASVTPTATTTVCPYATSGSLVVTPGGGTAGYTYLWSNSLGTSATATPTSTSAIVYTVTVTDTKSCTATASTGSVNVDPAMAVVPTPGSATLYCHYATSGVLAANASGGTTSFSTYAWSGGLGSSSTASPSSATATVYSVTVTDSKGCTASGSTGSITVDPAVTSTPTPSASTLYCSYANSGVLAANAGGGTAGYTYLWSNSLGTSATASPTSATATSYTVTVTDSHSCTVSASTGAVTIDPAVTVAPTPSAATNYCPYATSGVLAANAGGGTAGYTYLWSSSLGTASTATPTLTTGTVYSVTVTDTKSCTASASTGTVTVNPAIVVAPTPSVSPTYVCSYANTNALAANASGGIAGYTYVWSNSLGTGATATPTLATGTVYTVTVTDTKGCTATGSTGTVYDYAPPTITGTTPGFICGTGTVSLGATASAGVVNWWPTSAGGTPPSANTGGSYTTPIISTNTTYYVNATSNGCTTTGALTSVLATVYPTSITAGGFYYSTTSGFSPPAAGTRIMSTNAVTAGLVTQADTGLLPCTTYYYVTFIVTNGDTVYATNTKGTFTTGTLNATISLSSAAGTNAQTACYNTAITPITYSVGGGGTGAVVRGLPAGITGSFNSGTHQFTISGSSTVPGTYTYTDSTTGTCTQATTTGTITIESNLTAGLTGGSSPICYNTTPTAFTATGSGGTGSYSYQWYTGAGSISGATASTYSPGNITATTTYYCAVTSGTCGTVNTSSYVVTVDAALSSTFSGGNSPICYGATPSTFTVTGVGGTGSYTYQWYNTASGSISGATASTYSAGSLTATSTFYCNVTSGSCGNVNSSNYTVVVDGNLSAAITGGTSSICYNSAPLAFTATPTGGSGTYTYQWYTSAGSIGGATSSTYLPGNLTATTTYYAIVTSSAGCGTATTANSVVTVYANLTSALTGGSSPICYNTTPTTFTASGSGATGSYTFQWYTGSGSISGATASTYSPGNIATTTTYLCAVTSGSCGTVNTNSYTVNVDAAVSAAISGGSSPICYNTTPTAFTCTGSGGSGTYTYQWYTGAGSIGGATASTYSPGNITATTTYYCIATSGAGCGTGTTGNYVVTVDANFTSALTGGSTNICYNTTPTAFTATGTGGTGSYTYLWYKNASSTGITTSTYSAGALTATSTIYCAVTSGSCGTVNTSSYTVTVDANFTSALTGGSTNICYNTTPTAFTATGSGGTGSYTYLWYLNGSATSGTSSTYSAGALTATSTVYCAVTSGSCGTVNTSSYTVTVDANLTAALTGGSTNICYNTTPTAFTATGSGGTSSYTYLWYLNGSATSGTSSTYSAGALTATSTVYCAVTSGSCGTVNTSSYTVTVDGNLSAALTGGSTNICYNTTPTAFTATGSGGTSSYTYLWYLNGSATSGTSSTYSAGALTATSTVYCAVTSGGCGTVNTSSYTVTVDANLTASIAGGTTPTCYSSDPGTFTATGSGGTGSYTYQWYNSTGSVSGATASTYDPGTLTASDSYSCSVTSGSCGTVSTGASAITVEPAVSSYGTVNASGGLTQTVCDNVAPNSGNPFTVTGAAGSSGSFTYQWYYQAGLITAPSGSSTTGWTACGATQGSGFATSSFTAAGASSNITYACFVIPASPVCGAGQWAANDVQVTVLSSGPTESSSGGASVCIGATVNLSSLLSVVIPSTYQWYSSTDIGFSSPTTISGATSTTYAPSTSTAGTTYYEVVATFSGSGCSPATSNVQTVVVYATPTASISGGSSPICYNTNPGTFTATPAGGSGSFTYQWYKSSGSISGATASTYTPGSLTVSNSYYCSVTDVAGCGSASTSTTSITVDANLVPTISGGTTPLCYNTAPGTFTATGAGGTGSYTYQWYNGSGSVSGATASTYAPGNLTASNSYYCAVTSGSCGTANTAIKNITVHANLIANATGGTSPICYNTAPGTLSVTGGGGTGAYTYQWYNGASSVSGATASTYAPGALTVSSTYTCSVTSGACGTVASNIISITVDANLTASAAGGTSPICNGNDPGTITATGNGGTGSYTYQWYNGAGPISGATASTYDPGSITTSDAYYCSVTSGSCGTVSTNSISITVDATITAAISGGITLICYNGDPGVFTATGSGGTGSYTYVWYNGGGPISGATASTYDPGVLTISNSYYCAVTSASCGTANTSTTSITVDANLTAGITGGTSPICNNTDPGAFTVTGSGGTGTYTYQWYHTAGPISGATASTYDPGSITTSDIYSCSVTSGSCGTVATNNISISVDGSLSASISGGTTPICYNTAPGTFTATGSGGTSSYTYQWYNGSGSISGATASTYAPGSITTGDTYSCSVTSGSCGTATSNAISISVDGNLSTSITGGTSPICYNTAPGTLTSSVIGGSGSITYQWYNTGGSISGATASTYAPGNLTASNSYSLSVTDASCGTVGSNSIGISVNGTLTASAAGGTSPICYNIDPGSLTASGSGGSSSYTYQWYNSAGSISGATASTYDPGSITASDAYSCSVTDASCGTVATNTISITVDGNLTASASGGTTTVCYNSAPGTFTATGTGGTSSYTYQWYNTSGAVSGATASTYAPGNLTTGDAYNCSVTSGSCGTVATNTITISVNGNFTSGITGGTTPICSNTAPGTFTASGTGGTGTYAYLWYNNLGSISGATANTYTPGSITATTTYYCAVTSGSCGTVNTSNSVVTVNALPVPTFTASAGGNTCTSASVTYTTQTGQSTYIWTVPGTLGTDYSITSGGVGTSSNSVTLEWLTAGSKTVTVNYNNANGCTGATAASSTTIVGILNTYNVTGGNNCGISTVGLNGSDNSVNYQLVLNGSNTGSPVAGNGSAITFGSQTTTGTYTVKAIGCSTTTMTGSSVVYANPAVYSASGGNLCSADSVVLSSSQLGVSYQLVLSSTTNIGSPITGTGSPLDFGLVTTSGSYSVVATNANCSIRMSDSLTINGALNSYNVSGVSTCAGLTVTLSGSQPGVNYQLKRNGSVDMGLPLTANGPAITYPAQTAAGTYTVLAYAGACAVLMNDSAVTDTTSPSLYNVLGGTFCGSIVAGLSNSQIGFNYQLLLNGANTGSPVSGTGSSISFGDQYAAGTYTVNATNSLNPCVTAMNGSAQVVSSLTVVAPTISASPANSVCQGTSVSAAITAGSGGVSTTRDSVDYTTNGGISWHVYTSGTAINTTSDSGNNIIQIRAWRFDPTNPCYLSPFNYYYWSVGTPSTAATSVTSSVGTVCSGAGSNLTFTIVGGSLSASSKWELYDTDPTIGSPSPIGSTTGTSITVVQPSVAGPYTYYVRAESLAGTCATSAVSTSVTVTQSLDAYPSGNTASCSGNAESIPITSHVAGTTFSWTVGAITNAVTGATASSGTTITDVLGVDSGLLGTVTYIVTPINSSYTTCPAVNANIVVTVNSYVAMTSATTATTCNSHFSYIPTSNVPGATFTWLRGAVGGITPASSSGTGNIVNDSVSNTSNASIPVTYTIFISSACGVDTGTVLVTVNPQLGSGSPTIYVDRCGSGNLIRIDSLMGGNGVLPYTVYYTDITYGVHYSDLVISLPVSIVPPDLGTRYSVDSIDDYDNCKVLLGGTISVPTPVLSSQDVTVPCNLSLGVPVTYYNSEVNGGNTNAALMTTITATTVALDSTPVLLHVDTVTPVYNNQSFMKRNLHITPGTDSAATVTIYISQDEVDSLVTASANDPLPYQPLLPDLSNLVVSKYDGGSQSPTSHTAVQYLTPSSVIPNTPLPGVYAVTFNTTGFSGFFMNAKTPPSSVTTGSTANCSASTDTVTITLTGVAPWNMTYYNGHADTTVTGLTDSIYQFVVAPSTTTDYYVTALSDAYFTAPSTYLMDTAVVNITAGPANFYPTVAANPLCTGGATNIEIANSLSGVGYLLQLSSNGDSVGSTVTGTGGLIDLPTGTITASTTYQVQASNPGGCSSTTPANITVVAANPDIALGTQLSGQHFNFGTSINTVMPTGWTNPNNGQGNHWTFAIAEHASSGSYSYYNNLGASVGASTGYYISTPVNEASSTQIVQLNSGSIVTTGYTNISVQWGAHKTYGYTGTVNLYYSIDNGATFTLVPFTDVPAGITGAPWQLVNNTVQIKLPAAASNQSNLLLKWTANQSTDTNAYSMNDIGIYGLGKMVNCGGNSILLPYLNTSCAVSEYSLTAAATSTWPTSPAFNYVTGAAITGTPITVAVPSTTASGNYNLNIKVDDGASHYSNTIVFPVSTDLLSTATVGLDNCSCNYTTSGGMGSAYGNIVTVYAAGGAGTGFYFGSAGVVDTLLTTIDANDTAYAGTANHAGVKGVFWSKADNAPHSYTISDGYCTYTGTVVTQYHAPVTIPFGSATGLPTAITTMHGGGNGISGSFNNGGFGDANITNVNGNALTCHQRGYFGNTWVTYQVNNIDALGAPLAGDSTNNKAVVEINNNGTDLDSVEVSVYRDAYLPVVRNDLAAVACSGYPEYAMERHFMIKSNKSTGAGVFENGIGVRLYFTDAEFQDLAYWTMVQAQVATGQTAGCAYADTITNINSIYVTKFTGNLEDGNYGNNAPSGLYRVFGKNANAPGNGPLTAIDGGGATLTTGGTTNLHYVQMNVTEFSEFWLGGSAGGGEALPVTMLYLQAEALNNDSIQVSWATASEINNREFDVERSTDGNTWTEVNVTPGHDNSVVDQYYTFNDLNVTAGVVYYYRLKQVDNNGNYQYTGIVQAEITGQGAFAVMNFVPNPTSGNTQLTVTTTKAQEITVDFYDMLGQKILSSVQELNIGTNRIDFNLQHFASGTYSAVVTSENQLYTKKIVVTK